MRTPIAILLLAAIALPGLAAPEPPPVTAQRVAELRNLRFGMFICWSFSTFSGKEWTPDVTDINVFALDAGPDYAGKLREVDVRTLREVGRLIRGGQKPQ